MERLISIIKRVKKGKLHLSVRFGDAVQYYTKKAKLFTKLDSISNDITQDKIKKVKK